MGQAQFSQPRSGDRPLRFLFILCCLINVGPVLRHLLPWFQYEQQGILLDFIGRSTPPSRLNLFVLDITIFVLQVVCLFIAYEAHGIDAEPDELALDPDPADETPSTPLSEIGKIDEDAPILHLRFRRSWQKVWNNTPSWTSSASASSSTSIPLPNTTRNPSAAASSPIDRFFNIVQGRYLNRLGPQAQGQIPNARTGARGDDDAAPSMPGGMTGR
ncbi:hypothetical protein DL93DRAFT_1274084 [Clavulina sp. PMI_390]|nr:hypothetical protein DL93DRAFT_1274084 [Clavulina sp. PMI_390]